MEDLIIAILQGTFEFLLELLSGITPFDLIPSSNSYQSRSLWEKCIFWFAVGCGLAALSILFIKHTWIAHPTLRISNLILAPIVSAFIAESFAKYRRRNDDTIEPSENFWQAFWLTLGIVTVRFAYSIRH